MTITVKPEQVTIILKCDSCGATRTVRESFSNVLFDGLDSVCCNVCGEGDYTEVHEVNIEVE